VLEATVHDGSQQFWFEEEVTEARRVDGHVATLHGLFNGSGLCAIGIILGSGLGRVFLFVVIQQFRIHVVLTRHLPFSPVR